MKIGLEQYFAVPVMFGFLDKAVIDNSLNLSKQYMKDNSWETIEPTGKTITTFYTDITHNYLGLVNDQLMLENINDISRQFLEILGLDPDMDLIIETWLNLNNKLSGHYHHEHYGSVVSGVLYLETDGESGNLIFCDPVKTRTQAQDYNKKNRLSTNQHNFQTVTVKPEAGKVVLFESWLTHVVEPNTSDHNRISIAFNVYKDVKKSHG
jgi:uncharacterized protein (TIGR02466 family)